MEILWKDDTWQVVQKSIRLPSGKKIIKKQLKTSDEVHVIAFKDKDSILILREYRPKYNEYIWMLPSGKIDKETNTAIAAQRELREETGYRAEELVHFFDSHYKSDYLSTSHIFIARQLVHDPLPQDEDELIEVYEFTITEALNLIQNSKYVHTNSAYALLRYMHEHNDS